MVAFWVFLASFILSLLLCEKAAVILGEKDPQAIILDEVTGVLFACLFAAQTTASVFVCFMLFRIFDALKIPPADTFESFSGSIGILGDDLVAGVYTAGVLSVANFLLPIFR